MRGRGRWGVVVVAVFIINNITVIDLTLARAARLKTVKRRNIVQILSKDLLD